MSIGIRCSRAMGFDVSASFSGVNPFSSCSAGVSASTTIRGVQLDRVAVEPAQPPPKRLGAPCPRADRVGELVDADAELGDCSLLPVPAHRVSSAPCPTTAISTSRTSRCSPGTRTTSSGFGRKQMDSRDLGVSRYRIAPDTRSPFAHRHREQEEAYVVASGSGRMLLEGEVIELRQWDVVRVAPAVGRAFESGPDGMELIAIGGPSPRAATASRPSSTGRSRWRSSTSPGSPCCGSGPSARLHRDRDRGRPRLGRAAPHLVPEARQGRRRLRRLHGAPAADRLPRLRLHDPAGDPPPPVRLRAGLEHRGRARAARDLLRAGRDLGLPLVRDEPRLHREAVPSAGTSGGSRCRGSGASRSTTTWASAALDRPRGAGRARRRRRRAAARPPVAPRRPHRAHRARGARRPALPPLVPAHAPRGGRRPRRHPDLRRAGGARGLEPRDPGHTPAGPTRTTA